jgi:HK97 family phage major capsid protein
VRQLNPFRRLVSVRQAGSSDFHVLVSMGDGAAGWVSETATRTATNSPTLRDVAPTHGETYALPTATEWSLQDLFFDVSEWLTTEAGDEFSSLEATAIVSGNGTNRPTGLLNSAPTNVDDNASPMRAQDVLEYVPSGGASTITSDGLVDLAVGSIAERYLLDTTAVAWVMHRSTLATVRKLKASGTGEYLFSPGMTAGVAGQLLGYPVFTCDAVPVVATNSHSIIFGNWR